jgi:tetratricopeptide (TPR) repeat protein
MTNHSFYIDSNAIKLGDCAQKIGDYNLAISSYSKALDRLKKYQGDKMLPIQIGADLQKKLNLLERKTQRGKPILKFDSWKLTKTSFVKGSKCHKNLYLDKHKRGESTPFTDEQLNLFKEGHIFEETVRQNEFPDGLDIKNEVGNFAYFNSYTKYILSFSITPILYEASIIEDDVLVMCDILVKSKNGLCDIYEIKLNSSLNEAILEDLAIQYAICKKRFGKNLNSFSVILRKENTKTEYTIQNVKKEMESKLIATEQKIQKYKQILDNKEPNVHIGDHCFNPYKCEFIAYCKKLA